MSTFVIDLDGTLLSESGELEPNVASHLIQVQKMGHRIIVASGRTYCEAEAIINALELKKHRGAAVLADGQYIFDYSTDEKCVRERLTTGDIKKIIKGINASEQLVKAFTSCNTYVIFHTKFCFKYLKYLIAGWLKKSKDRLIDVKYLGRIAEADKIAVDPSANVAHLKDDYEVAYINDKGRYEIKQKNVNKASSVKQLLRGDCEDVFVFGNDENDICLFQAFPNSYVMEDSTDTVKKYVKNIIFTSKGASVISQILQIVGIEE